MPRIQSAQISQQTKFGIKVAADYLISILMDKQWAGAGPRIRKYCSSNLAGNTRVPDNKLPSTRRNWGPPLSECLKLLNETIIEFPSTCTSCRCNAWEGPPRFFGINSPILRYALNANTIITLNNMHSYLAVAKLGTASTSFCNMSLVIGNRTSGAAASFRAPAIILITRKDLDISGNSSNLCTYISPDTCVAMEEGAAPSKNKKAINSTKLFVVIGNSFCSDIISTNSLYFRQDRSYASCELVASASFRRPLATSHSCSV